MTGLSPGAEEFLSWLAVERGRAANTVASYRRDLVAYQATLTDLGRAPESAVPEDVDRHLDRLRARGASPASLARATSAVRGLHRFLLDEGLAADDPTRGTVTEPLPGRLPKALSEADVARLLGSVEGADPAARRDRALLELLYATGARISEAVDLDLADVADVADVAEMAGATEPAGVAESPGLAESSGVAGVTGQGPAPRGLVRLYGKGAKERLVPVGRFAARALALWLAPGGRDAMAPERWRKRTDAQALFLNARGGRLGRAGAHGIVRARARAAGLGPDVSPHVLRHSCATHLLAHGADIRVVQEVLGHASVTTTQLYTKVTPEHLRAAYLAAHPRAGGEGAGNAGGP